MGSSYLSVCREIQCTQRSENKGSDTKEVQDLVLPYYICHFHYETHITHAELKSENQKWCKIVMYNRTYLLSFDHQILLIYF